MSLMQKEFWDNSLVSSEGKQYMSNLLEYVEVGEVYMGCIYTYSSKVLVLEVRPKEQISLQMACRPPLVVAEGELIFVEVCLDETDGFAIQISDKEGNPLGFIDLGD